MLYIVYCATRDHDHTALCLDGQLLCLWSAALICHGVLFPPFLFWPCVCKSGCGHLHAVCVSHCLHWAELCKQLAAVEGRMRALNYSEQRIQVRLASSAATTICACTNPWQSVFGRGRRGMVFRQADKQPVVSRQPYCSHVAAWAWTLGSSELFNCMMPRGHLFNPISPTWKACVRLFE